MAIFPQGLTNVDARCNPGERRVLQALKRCLGNDWLVWHDVPVGAHARQPDFVVLSPNRGLLLLEVKGWKRSTLVGGTRDAVELETARGRVAEPNPLRQVRDHALELVDQMQRDPALVRREGPFRGKLLFPFGCGVVLAGIRASEVSDRAGFDAIFPPARTLLRDALDDTVAPADFEQRLWDMFTVHFAHTLSLPQRDRIRWHLFPEVRLDAQAALFGDGDPAAPLALPDLMQVMDLQQEQVARTLGEGHRVIHGAAGSGKTMILIFRAEQLAAAARPDKPILVVCFNRALAERLDELLRARGVDERVVVRTFHAWCEDLVRAYALEVPRGPDADARFEALAASVERAVATGRVPGGQYTALLIDEAHDFEDAWLRIAVRMVDPASNSLLVLYDDAQSIYRRKRQGFSFASVGVEARGRTHVLKVNYRNTAEILALAVRCADPAPGAQADADADAGEDAIPRVAPTSAGRRGPLPVLIEERSEAEELRQVAERIAGAIADGARPGEIAVIGRYGTILDQTAAMLERRGIASRRLGRRAQNRAEAVGLITLHGVKGLEFPRVYLVGLQALPRAGEPLEDELRLLYVAMTRATETLTLSAHRDSAITRRVREALVGVARQFAALGSR